MKWEFKHGDKSITCEIPANISSGSETVVRLGDHEYQVLWQTNAKRLTVMRALDNGSYLEEYLYLEQIATQAFNGGAEVNLLYWQGGKLKQIQGRIGLAMALRERQHATSEIAQTINSPLTGKVIQVHAVAGKTVNKGELLLVIEAMKMENRIQAPADATIVEVQATLNSMVNVGDTLLKLQKV